MAALPWKPCFVFLQLSFWQHSLSSCFGRDCSKGERIFSPSSAAENCSCRKKEGGFLLVFLLPLLLLIFLFLAGSLKVAWKTQNKVALQSRLDVCALRMALERKRVLSLLVKGNQMISLTVIGIYAARGAKAAGPVGAVLGGASEAVLLRMNGALANLQEAQLRIAGGRELSRFRCEPGQYSKESSTCLPIPPLLQATYRESTLFPDVKGSLTHKSNGENLATFRCESGMRSFAAVEIRGSRQLKMDDLSDAWTE